MLRLALFAGVGALLLAAVMARVTAVGGLLTPLTVVMWLTIGVSAFAGGLSVANSSLSENQLLRGFLGFVLAPVIAAALVFLALVVYMVCGGSIH